jgi:hypothetical membrane protein
LPTKSKTLFESYAPLCGMMGPGIIALGMIISTLAYTGVDGQTYSPLNHFVSELGEVGVSSMSGAFNWSLIFGGLITIPFMVYLAGQIRFWIRWPLGILGVLTAVFAVLVGIFPMNYVNPHTFAALTFFNLGLTVAILYSLVILFSSRQPFPKWLAIPGLLYALTFTWFSFFPSAIPAEIDFEAGMAGFLSNRPDLFALAVIEWVMVLAILIWILLMGIYLTIIRENSRIS